MTGSSFFTRDTAGRFVPTAAAHSLWGPDALNGPAVCALAAYACEAAAGTSSSLRPARFTVDLFKSPRHLTTSVRTRVERDGRRIRVIGFEVCQHDGDEEILVARGVTVFLAVSSNPDGARWSRPPVAQTFTPPSVDPDDHRPRFGGEQGWTTAMGDHQNADRHRLWSEPVRAVAGEPLTPFQRAVITGESTSLVTNWGEGGISFINCDLTVAVARLPEGPRIGVEADFHLEADGISVGSAVLYDADGPFGTATVTAVQNSAAAIDFTVDRPLPGWTTPSAE